ncbi:uncharacterized protein EV154DRAFT_586617, partial [Mucor mucedo]|uniref:uncharacterized protein n=1 Tax=Mucor mucedo TaxID=29922 RepID=UPI002220ACE3
SLSMSTSSNPEEVNSFASMLAEQRVNNTTLVAPFQPGQDISHWIKQFHLSAKSLGMNSTTSRNLQMLKYLPQEATDWLLRVTDFSSSTDIKTKLESVYGIDPAIQKSNCRQRLESLKQGLRRVAEYRMNFETIVSDFPEGHTLSDDTLRNIFFNNLRPELHTALLGIVDPSDTWKTLAASAAIRESVLSLGNDHFLTPQPQAPIFDGPTPMEVDSVQKHRNQRSSGKPDKRKEDPMRRWAASGQPICGICGTEGHLTKKCPRKTERVQSVEKVKESTPNVAPIPSGTVQYVSSVSPVQAGLISPVLHNITVPTDASSTPKIRVHFKGQSALGLIDTGASVTVMRSSLAKQLNLVPDTTNRIYFTTAGNQVHTSLGMVKVSALLGELPVILDCHVAPEL